MTPEQFCYWLQGFFEISDPAQIDAKKTKEIKNHLALVMKKETPNVTDIHNPSLFHPTMKTEFIC